jgi:ABC-type amino acid transport substrate-binding protein
MQRLALIALVFAVVYLQLPTSKQTVRIGAYHFPPYAVDTAEGMGGMVGELVAALNAMQGDYRFEVVPTSALARRDDFAAGAFDLVAFDNPAWGWQDLEVDASEPFLEDEAVYVARREDGRDQGFFDDIASREIAAVWGHHYGFAGFDADPATLERRFDIWLPLTTSTALVYVLEGRAELAVVPRLYLDIFLARHPQFQGRLLVSDRPDQIQRHAILVRRGIRPTVAEIDALLARLAETGEIERIVAAVRP